MLEWLTGKLNGWFRKLKKYTLIFISWACFTTYDFVESPVTLIIFTASLYYPLDFFFLKKHTTDKGNVPILTNNTCTTLYLVSKIIHHLQRCYFYIKGKLIKKRKRKRNKPSVKCFRESHILCVQLHINVRQGSSTFF